MLPESIANQILDLVLRNVAITPSKLALFKEIASTVSIDGHRFPGPTPANLDWFLAASQFRNLQRLELTSCPKLRDEHLQPLASASSSLTHITIASCQRITTAIINHITHLSTLKSLAIPDCAASQSLPPTVSALHSLQELNLGGHKLPDSALTHLTPLSALESLVLWGNEITQSGIEWMTTLTSLTALDCSWTYVSHAVPLPALKRLDLQHCEVGGDWHGTYAMYLSQNNGAPFSGLTYLNLRSSRFECMMPYKVGEDLLLYLIDAAKDSLQHLHLEDARLSTSGIPPVLQALQAATALKCLDWSGAPLGAPEGLQRISALPALERLTLLRCRTSDADAAAIAALTSLGVLSLSESVITDAGLAALTALSRLTRLHLAGDLFKGLLASSQPRGGRRHPREHPSASNVAMEASGASAIAHGSGLVGGYEQPGGFASSSAVLQGEPGLAHAALQPSAAARDEAVRDAHGTMSGRTDGDGGGAGGGDGWGALAALRHLDLQAPQLTGACRQIATALTALTALRLESRSVGDASLVCLAAHLRRLRQLEVLRASLSGRGIAALLDAPALQHVELRWCQLYATAWPALERLHAALARRRGRVAVDGADVAPPPGGTDATAAGGPAAPPAAVDERFTYSPDDLTTIRQLAGEGCRSWPVDENGARVAIPAALAVSRW